MINVSSEWIQANAAMLVPITTMECFIYDARPGHSSEQEYTWTKDTIKRIEFGIHGDILSGTLPDYECIVECDNILGENGLYVITDENRMRLAGAEFFLEYGYKNIAGKIQYSLFIQNVDINKDSNTVVFTLKTALSFMTTKYPDSILQTGTAYEVAESVFAQEYTNDYVPKPSGGADVYVLDESLNDYQISLVDTNLSTAEILQVIANACKCIIMVDFIGTIHILPRDTEMKSYSLSRQCQYSRPIESVDQPIRGCKFYCSGAVSGAAYPSGLSKGQWIELTNQNLYADSGTTASAVAKWASDELALNPKVFEVTVRYDPRLELFDVVQIQVGNEIHKAVVTDIKISYNGAWRGEIKLRDNGDGQLYTDDNFDVYNVMMEYLAAVENGEGDYQPYAASYDDMVAYLEQHLNILYICDSDGEILTTSDGRMIVCGR